MGGVNTLTVIQSCGQSPELMVLGIAEGIKAQRIASALGLASASSAAAAKGVVRDVSQAVSQRQHGKQGK